MTLLTERDDEIKAARAIVDAAKAEGRDPDDDETTKLTGHLGKIADLNSRIKSAEVRADTLRQVAALGAPDAERPAEPANETKAADLGDHFVKSGMFNAIKAKRGSRFAVDGPEFKAATDPTLTSNTGGLPVTYGGAYQTLYRRLTVADLLASGRLSSPALTYWVQGALTGDVASVAEGATKPALNFVFGQVTEALAKLAGVTKVSDEMTEDADFLVSIIRSQLLQRLAVIEEDQLLKGNGTSPNLRGLLNRSGIQTYATAASFTVKKGMDGIFHAMTLVRTGSYIEPDGIIINPTDYETLRLGVDGQQQYYGGGPFTGAYGNGTVQMQPGLWGLPTVVTPAITAGTVLVGGFKTAAQVFRKGGVRLETTNSNEDDFKNNLVAIRVEERVGLAVYYPTALCKVTLTA